MPVLPRKLRQRLSTVSRPVTVRPQRAWYWRALALVGLASVSVAIGLWIYDASRHLSGVESSESERERRVLKERIAELEKEAVRLRSSVDSSDSRIQVERTAQGQLAKQVKVLEEDNARLREELALYESLSPATDRAKDARLTIHRFRVEPNGVPGEYKYRMLVAQPAARDSREFQGSVQLVVTLQRESKSVIVTLPEARADGAKAAAGDPGYRLSFRRVQRVEGLFRVEPTATVKTVQVRVLENGVAQPRAVESFSLSS